MSRMTPLVEHFMQHGRVDDCPIVDLHTHPDRYAAIHFPEPDLDGILRTMDRCNVRLIAMAPHAALMDPRQGNPVTLRMMQAHSDRLRAYLCYNPQYPQDLEGFLRTAEDTPGVIGFKIHPGWHQCALGDDRYQPLFAWANAHRKVVLSHTWNSPLCGVPDCRVVAERYPEIRFLLGHSCYGDWDGVIALGRQYPNVYLELTAANYVAGFIDRAVHAGLAKQLLFGTDLPWHDPMYVAGCVLCADIDDDARRAILHGNAERILAEVEGV